MTPAGLYLWCHHGYTHWVTDSVSNLACSVQMQYIDSLNGEDLLLTGEVKWRPLVEENAQSILKVATPTYNDAGLWEEESDPCFLPSPTLTPLCPLTCRHVTCLSLCGMTRGFKSDRRSLTVSFFFFFFSHAPKHRVFLLSWCIHQSLEVQCRQGRRSGICFTSITQTRQIRKRYASSSSSSSTALPLGSRASAVSSLQTAATPAENEVFCIYIFLVVSVNATRYLKYFVFLHIYALSLCSVKFHLKHVMSGDDVILSGSSWSSPACVCNAHDALGPKQEAAFKTNENVF